MLNGHWENTLNFERDTLNTDESLFKAYYWYHKAALQACGPCQAKMSVLVQRCKANVFGSHDQVGYSAMSEARFWAQQARLNGVLTESEMYQTVSDPFATLVHCAGCGTRETVSSVHDMDIPGSVKTVAAIKRCVQCSAIGYCSKTCQTNHWKLGHKVDCRKKVALEQLLKPWYSTGGTLPNVATRTTPSRSNAGITSRPNPYGSIHYEVPLPTPADSNVSFSIACDMRPVFQTP